MQYTIPKGVFDIVPFEPDEEERWRNSDHWNYVEEIMRKTANNYGFKEIRTPIFERTELFVRGVGESSDIISKEMYTFLDKAERSMSLRPEATAAVMRAFIEKHLEQLPTLHKFFYIGPMFRYERPQAGRYRQHHQFGAEAIGIANPEQDVEVIDMLCELYRRLGLKQLTIILNSVGDETCRASYKEALAKYLRPHFDQLSVESQQRFSKNILRILDSKDVQDQKLLENAPSILDHLNDKCQDHFKRVQQLLKSIHLPFVVSAKLVRGLDYYNKTVFEITSGELGAQNSIVGGGRYDGLMKTLGGPDLPAFGFATGIERILQTMAKQSVAFPPPPHPLLFIIPMGQTALDFSFDLTCKLRHAKISAEIDLSGKKVQHGLQLANSLHADYCIVIGDEELHAQTVKLKNMTTREVEEIPLKSLLTRLSIGMNVLAKK
jgi:histidyl-tRNA synthetase